MKEKLSKTVIVSLITDDLIHTKLVDGLEQLDLNPENYSLDLSDTIIDLMGVEGEQNEFLFQCYLDLKKRARFVKISKDNEHIQKLARDIYHNLQLQKPLETEE